MSDILAVLLALALFGGAALALHWNWRTQARRNAELAALALRRGLALDRSRVHPSGARQIRLSDPADTWDLILTQPYRRRSGRSETSTSGNTLLTFTAPRLDDGMVIYLPPHAAGPPQLAAQLLGRMDNALGRMILGKLLGPEVAPHLPRLRVQPVAPDTPLMILGTRDPAADFDTAAVARVLTGDSGGEIGRAHV